jgi:6-pyruvoyltetrahydropterin/6-carboxytetrahydropterin synthase
MFQVTKTYGHELGLSACFRQWRADSHCRFLHGYPLSFKLTFEAEVLDKNNWVIDFGGLKSVKAWLVDTFDHKLVLAEDDPSLDVLMALSDPDLPEGQLADVSILPAVGCESFAKHVFRHVEDWLYDQGHAPRVSLVEVECREHGGNSAIFQGE